MKVTKITMYRSFTQWPIRVSRLKDGWLIHVFSVREYTSPNEKKRTCVWSGNNFVMPPVEVWSEPADVKDSCHKMPPSKDRADKRSVTPAGFARAVYEANAKWVEPVERMLREVNDGAAR